MNFVANDACNYWSSISSPPDREMRVGPVPDQQAVSQQHAGACSTIAAFNYLYKAQELVVQDINPIKTRITDLKGRVGALRGYL